MTNTVYTIQSSLGNSKSAIVIRIVISMLHHYNIQRYDGTSLYVIKPRHSIPLTLCKVLGPHESQIYFNWRRLLLNYSTLITSRFHRVPSENKAIYQSHQGHHRGIHILHISSIINIFPFLRCSTNQTLRAQHCQVRGVITKVLLNYILLRMINGPFLYWQMLSEENVAIG